MPNVHQIEVGREVYTLNTAKAPMTYRGEVIGSSRQPIYDAARYLLDNNLASPDDMIETWRGGVLCMFGVVGEIAKRTVMERRNGLVETAFQPFDPSVMPARKPVTGVGATTIAKISPRPINGETRKRQTTIPRGAAAHISPVKPVTTLEQRRAADQTGAKAA